MRTKRAFGQILSAVLFVASGHGQQLNVDPDGTVHIPAFSVPLSSHMSPQAKQQFIEQSRVAPAAKDAPSEPNCPGREEVKNFFTPLVERARADYPVTIHDQTIAGVHTDVISPSSGLAPGNPDRVLINLHGGSFSCATTGGLIGLVESIPIAGSGRFKVIAIDYRSLPDSHFPAAIEDVTAVYRELLKSYPPRNIGIFGSSTGASLTASELAWLQEKGLPRPGAIGLFSEGANKDDEIRGDASYIAPALNGQGVPVPQEDPWTSPYLSGMSAKDPRVAPINFPEVLSHFPPTLLISGTRDHAMSEVLYTHTRLVAEGVKADLHVWDGMWHGFFIYVDLPESKEAFAVISKFFDSNLGKRAALNSKVTK